VDTKQVISIAAIIFKMKSYLYSLDEIKWLKISQIKNLNEEFGKR
jgi:hypothetical protein